MKKRVFIFSPLICFASIFSVGVLLVANNASVFTHADINPYKMVMNSERNKFHNNTGTTAYSGETIAKTNLNHDVSFAYTDLMGLATTWHVAKTGGGFYNTSAINGLQSISLTFKTDAKEFKLYWSGDTTFVDSKSQTFTSSTSSLTIFDFNNENPSYFKFVNTSGSNLNISEVELEYSCVNNYPKLIVSSNDTTMGTVSGDSGTLHTGQVATITATPNQGYRFVGWYSDGVLVNENASFSITMGNGDLNYVAHFTYESYNLVVQSESTNKGTVSGSTGSYNYLTSITIEAFANEGYTFSGWYKGNTKVSASNPYTFNMPYEDTTFIAKFSTNKYSLTLINQDSTLGSISSSKTYSYGASVTIVATPNTGVSFLGWYDENGNIVSNLSSYTFSMPHKNTTYIAKFTWTPYSVNVSINNSSMGSISGNGTYTYGQAVNLVATPNEHYSFFGWYNGSTLLSQDPNYSFDMPDESLNYEARFVQNHNLYIYSDDETKGVVSYPTEWGEGLEVNIVANAFNGYALDYWYDEDLNEVSYDFSYTFVMPNSDVTLYATFTTGYILTVVSEDTLKGIVEGSGSFVPSRLVTVEVDVFKGTFKGWFDLDNQLVSRSKTYSFNMPSINYTIEAKFMSAEEEIKYATEPVFENAPQDTGWFSYGLYPQTHINDNSLISALNGLTSTDINGWYYYEGDFYASLNATPADSKCTFEDETTIVNGTKYWFKCEPIVWKILYRYTDSFWLGSTRVLDATIYCSTRDDRTIDGQTIHPTNYAYSNVREWLNTDFFTTAFSLQNRHIGTTVVDNPDDFANDPYNVNDKVFLLTATNRNTYYGFLSQKDPTRNATDWALARGARYFKYKNSTYPYAIEMTRTPNNILVLHTYPNPTTTGGTLYTANNQLPDTILGVRPSISLPFSAFDVVPDIYSSR